MKKLMMAAAGAVGLLAGVGTTSAFAATTWYVSPSGNDANDGKSEAAPFATVNAALSKLASDDEVVLASGTYAVTEPLSLGTVTGVTICGITGNRDDVVVDGGGTVGLFSSSGADVEIRDLTLRGSGSTLDLSGSGVKLKNVASVASGSVKLGAGAVVENCLFKDNKSGALNLYGSGCVVRGTSFVNNLWGSNNGAAVTTFSSNQSFFDCTFTGNSVTNASSSLNMGGAVYVTGSNALFSNCTFTANAATGEGGALAVPVGNNACLPFRLVDCTFARNTSGARGGAILCGPTPGGVVNCTFTGNVASNDVASCRGGAIAVVGRNGAGQYATVDVVSEFSGCLFASNVVYGAQGGALSFYHSRVVRFADCEFVGNEVRTNGLFTGANAGGGALCSQEMQTYNNDRLFVDRCRFADNRTSACGGAVNLNAAYGVNLYFRNCLFDGNACTGGTSSGGALTTSYCPIELSNCTFVRNQSSYWAPAVFLYGNDAKNCGITNCVFALNASPKESSFSYCKNYCDVAWTDTTSEWTAYGFVLYNCYTYIDTSLELKYSASCCSTLAAERNCFTNSTLPFVDAAAGNFEPKKDSAILDKGLFADWMTGAADIRGNARKYGRVNGTVDLGCYEFWPVRGIMFIIR